jgi:transcriptional regulator GlxA family with amidase domain
MFRRSLAGLFAVALLVAVGCAAPPASTPKQVLLVVSENSLDLDLMLTKEVGVMIPTLEKAGYKVVVATATGKTMATRNSILNPNLNLAAVNVDDYAGVLLPCMGTGRTYIATAEPLATAELVKQAVAKNKTVAAQDASVYFLARAGVLRGKQYAVFDGPKYEKVPDAIHKGTGVVQDGNIITSGSCPMLVAAGHATSDTTVPLTQKFIAALAGGR